MAAAAAAAQITAPTAGGRAALLRSGGLGPSRSSATDQVPASDLDEIDEMEELDDSAAEKKRRSVPDLAQYVAEQEKSEDPALAARDTTSAIFIPSARRTAAGKSTSRAPPSSKLSQEDVRRFKRRMSVSFL